jgi:hypothetical protein
MLPPAGGGGGEERGENWICYLMEGGDPAGIRIRPGVDGC